MHPKRAATVRKASGRIWDDWSGFAWAYYLNADRVLADTFYLYYAGHGVFKSTDGGADWTKAFRAKSLRIPISMQS